MLPLLPPTFHHDLVVSTTIAGLFRNLVPVGQNQFFIGTVTDAGRQYSPGVQNLLFYLENSREFNNIPGVSTRESVLLELQNVERAKLGLETEVRRHREAIRILQEERDRRLRNQ